MYFVRTDPKDRSCKEINQVMPCVEAVLPTVHSFPVVSAGSVLR
jgi:hypothetical protein